MSSWLELVVDAFTLSPATLAHDTNQLFVSPNGRTPTELARAVCVLQQTDVVREIRGAFLGMSHHEWMSLTYLFVTHTHKKKQQSFDVCAHQVWGFTRLARRLCYAVIYVTRMLCISGMILHPFFVEQKLVQNVSEKCNLKCVVLSTVCFQG